jgi:hypothetical protein
VVNNGVASTIYVPFQLSLSQPLAGAFCVEDGNGVLTVFHSKPHVAQDVADAAGLVAHCRSPEVGAIVLISANGSHENDGGGISLLEETRLHTGLKLIVFARF